VNCSVYANLRSWSMRFGLSSWLSARSSTFSMFSLPRACAIAVAQSCNYHSQAICHIRRLLSTELAVTLACTLILTRLDYCNSMLYGAPASNIQVLQRVQNNAAMQDRSRRSYACVSCIGCPFNTESSTRWLCWPSRVAAAPQHRHTSVVTSRLESVNGHFAHLPSRYTGQAVHQDRLRETSLSLFCINCL